MNPPNPALISSPSDARDRWGRTMFECQVCGLLSLGGTSCPACGSQLRKDLSIEQSGDEVLPTEVPGLDEAAEAWYELEGLEPPLVEDEPAVQPARSSPSTLPFGYQGSSNVYTPNLPFGIGSFADGIPFDAANQSEPPPPEPTAPEAVFDAAEHPASETVAGTTPVPTEATSVIDTVLEDDSPATDDPELELPPVPDLPEVVIPDLSAEISDVFEVQPPPPSPGELNDEPIRLSSARLVSSGPVQDEPPVPDYWKIDAPIPDYEEIYGQEAAVVEVEYASLQEDVVIYDHSTDSPAAVFHSPLEASPNTTASRSVKLQLHPAQALGVDTGGDQAMAEPLAAGFRALQQADWSAAARSFQRMAAGMPNNPEVFNNYGISLLQRATAMRTSNDGQEQAVSETQFESSILALREAAKNAPANGDVLVNLAIALIESGRSEKALGIMNVHNARTPNSAKGLNTAAVAMFNLGQLSQAVETLGKAGNDEIARRNLAKIAPN